MRVASFAAFVTVVGCGGAPEAPPAAPPASSPGPASAEATPTSTSATLALPASDEPLRADDGDRPAGAKANDEGANDEKAPDATGGLAPLPKGTTVLHIGDSMAAALAHELKEQLAAQDIRVINDTKEGTHLPLWGGKFSHVPGLVKTHKPDLVIVNLGGNDAVIDDPSDRVESIERLVQHLGGTPCVWVAPSLWAGENGVLAMIREHSKPCRYFDTNAITPNLPREKKDKVHPSLEGRRIWATALVDWLAHERDPNGARPFALKPE